MITDLGRNLFYGLLIELFVVVVALLVREDKRRLAQILAGGTLIAGLIGFSPQIIELVSSMPKTSPPPNSSEPTPAAIDTLSPTQRSTNTASLSIQPTSFATQSSQAPCSDVVLVGSADSKVYEIDTFAGTIIEEIGLSSGQLGLLTWNQSRYEAYSADYNGDVISIIQPSPLSEMATIKQDVGWNAYSMAISPDGRSLYASFSLGDNNSYRQVVLFDPVARSSLSKVRLTDTYGEIYLALSSDGEILYVSWDSNLGLFSKDLSLIRYESFVTENSGRLAISSDNRYLYIAQTDKLVKWNINARQVEKTISLPGVNGSAWIEVSRDGQRVWIGGSTYGNPASLIYEVQASLNGYKTLRLEAGPYSFTQSSDGRCLYSTSFDNGITMTDISTGENRMLASIQAVTSIIVIPH